MKKIGYRILPWMAFSSGILGILLLVLAIILKPSPNIEGTINRTIALDQLRHISIDSPENLNSKAFFGYIENALNSSVISTKWLISAEGKIIYANGVMAQSTPVNSIIKNLVDAQNRGLIGAVEWNVDSLQMRMLYVAAAIRSEGEHNDIYGHLVIPLKTSSNELVGFVGVAYTLDDSKSPSRYYYLIIISLIVCFLLYWLLLPLWVYFDCCERNNKSVLWALFVLLGNIPAFIAYLISDRKYKRQDNE